MDTSNTRYRDLVQVSHHIFYLADDGAIPVDFVPPSNGIIAVNLNAATVLTGIHTGVVDVEVEVRRNPSPQVETGPWDEVVEVGVQVTRGNLKVTSMMGERPGLPNLSSSGPGQYRVRVHARGRDSMPDGVASEPVEQYLITTWPSPFSPEKAYKHSDQYGATWRRSARSHQTAARTSVVGDTNRRSLERENLRRWSAR